MSDSIPTLNKEEEQETQNHTRLQELKYTAARELEAKISLNRSKKTETTWAGKKKEFLEWNNKQGYPSSAVDTVNSCCF